MESSRKISEREIDRIRDLIGQGKTYKQAADECGVCESTVYKYAVGRQPDTKEPSKIPQKILDDWDYWASYVLRRLKQMENKP